MGYYRSNVKLGDSWLEELGPAVERLYQMYETYQVGQSEQRRLELQLAYEKELERLRTEAEARAAAEAAARPRIDWRLLGMVAAMGLGVFLVVKKPEPVKKKKHVRK